MGLYGSPIVTKQSANNGQTVPEDRQGLPEKRHFSPNTCRPFLVETAFRVFHTGHDRPSKPHAWAPTGATIPSPVTVSVVTRHETPIVKLCIAVALLCTYTDLVTIEAPSTGTVAYQATYAQKLSAALADGLMVGGVQLAAYHRNAILKNSLMANIPNDHFGLVCTVVGKSWLAYSRRCPSI